LVISYLRGIPFEVGAGDDANEDDDDCNHDDDRNPTNETDLDVILPMEVTIVYWLVFWKIQVVYGLVAFTVYQDELIWIVHSLGRLYRCRWFLLILILIFWVFNVGRSPVICIVVGVYGKVLDHDFFLDVDVALAEILKD
jgi:hypothetical protein